ncbi:hypothetical protein RJI07_04940 [Mycoplasmatota bacterium WC30]
MRKKAIVYILISVSIGYLFYYYTFTDYGYGMMMNHHYDYYDGFSRTAYYLNAILVFVSYTIIIISTIFLITKKTVSKNNSMIILDERLSKSEISIEEYQKIKRVIDTK